MEWLPYWVNDLSKYTTSEFWHSTIKGLSQKSIMVVLIIILTWLMLRVRKIIIHRIFKITRMNERQERTLEALLLSLTRYIFFIIAVMMCMSNLGMEIGPIIASAGVIGIAIGFGAQTLVKDLITGFFIIFEDQFSVGDYVTINNGEINGTIVDVGLRATKIRTWAQHVVVIQNSEIRVSQNYNRERMRAIIHVTVPYESDPAVIENAVNQVSGELVRQFPYMFLKDSRGEPVEAPMLYGITDVENNALGAKYTVTALVKDEHYWTACKEIRRHLVEHLKMHGVSISYPRREYHEVYRRKEEPSASTQIKDTDPLPSPYRQ